MKLQVQLRQSKLIFERKTTNKIEPEKCQKKGQEKRKENRYRRVLQSQQSMIAGSVMIYQSQLTFVAQSLKLVSQELIHFGVIARLFRQIGVHSGRFVLFCSF